MALYRLKRFVIAFEESEGTQKIINTCMYRSVENEKQSWNIETEY